MNATNLIPNFAELKVTVQDNGLNDNQTSATSLKSNSLNFEDLLKIIQAQQSTINKLSKEVKRLVFFFSFFIIRLLICLTID